MITHTIEVNQLDTITKHLIDINQQLVAIKKDTTVADTYRTLTLIISIASPLVVGFVLFVLNRNKEYKIKKSELCGNIYMYLEELKIKRTRLTYASIVHNGYRRCFELLKEAQYEEKHVKMINDFYSDAVIDFDKSNDEEDIAFQNLMKHIGQYRFYLTKDKKQQLDVLIKPFTTKTKLSYDFKELTDVSEITKRVQEIIKLYNTDMKEPTDKMYADITKFIDDNEEDNNF